MPDVQSDPPKMEHMAPPWFKDYMRKLVQWLKDNRPIQGDNITITSADGGGLKINAEAGLGMGQAQVYVAIEGQIKEGYIFFKEKVEE